MINICEKFSYAMYIMIIKKSKRKQVNKYFERAYTWL